jgi:hypothetical protein
MASKAASVPRENEILCEHCGYGLDGLPQTGLCPECGNPIADSTVADGRVAPLWEQAGVSFRRRFWGTTWEVIFRPGRFYRSLRTRDDPRKSRTFALLHHWFAGYLFAVATSAHLLYFVPLGRRVDGVEFAFFVLAGGGMLAPVVFASILGIRLLAGRLSSLEARYHGMRLPHGAVTRALHYHAAELLPVAGVTAGITVGYPLLVGCGLLPRDSEIAYLYTLSGWVIAAAAYLFVTYWKGMKAIMYANR